MINYPNITIIVNTSSLRNNLVFRINYRAIEGSLCHSK